MSNQSENMNPQKKNDAIAINENGEVVIKDRKLAEAFQELSLEELEAVAGGLKELTSSADGNGTNCTCNGTSSTLD